MLLLVTIRVSNEFSSHHRIFITSRLLVERVEIIHLGIIIVKYTLELLSSFSVTNGSSAGVLESTAKKAEIGFSNAIYRFPI